MGGIGEIIEIVSAVASVAQVGMSIMGASAQKKQAARQEQLALERENIRQQELAIERQRADNKLRAETRARQAQLFNRASQMGVLDSSTLGGGVNALERSYEREKGYIEQGASLASSADAITRAQIELNADNAITNANLGVFGGVMGGLKGLSEAVKGITIPNQIDFSDPVGNPNNATPLASD